jgi:hypothetical protein
VISEQVNIKRADRVHLVNVKSQRELPEPPPPEGARDPVSAPASH